MTSHHNGLKTALLFGLMWAVLLALGGAIGGLTRNTAWIWGFAAFGLIGTAISYWQSDRIALRSMRAQPVTEQQAPGMYAIVRDLSQRAGQPMPRLYVSPTQSPNAFATGRSPQHAAVCCTEGILRLLDERQLRGVLAHELMHVYNRDILTSSVAAAMAGVLGSVGQLLLFTGGGGRDRRGGSPLALIGTLVLALVAPLAGSLIQLGISRTREFDADEDGARLSGDPEALASALAALQTGVTRAPLAPTAEARNVSHMMIANPFRPGAVGRLFSTHPPMEERIDRLRGMTTRPGEHRI